MEHSDICKIFVDGIENIMASDIKEIERENYKLRTIKMLLFYLLTAFLSCRKKLTKEILIIGRLDKEEVLSEETTVSKVYRQRCIKSFKDIRNKTTIISVFKRSKRIKLVLQSIRTGRKLINQCCFRKELLSYWVDYYLIREFLEFIRPVLVIHRFHYDEKATWIGELKEKYEYEVDIYQHGVLSGELNLPHKIMADRVFCFDLYSVDYFRQEILNKAVQEVSVYEFPDVLEFSKVSEDPKYTHIIGIAEQCNEKWTIDLVNSIVENNSDCMVYIMIHPQSNADYGCFDHCTNIKITTKKIDNLDCLVTYNSTLIIDYYRHNKKYIIFYMSEKDKPMYRDYPFTYTSNAKDILDCLRL